LDESFKVRDNTFGEGVIFMIPIQLDESAVGLSFSDKIILGRRVRRTGGNKLYHAEFLVLLKIICYSDFIT